MRKLKKESLHTRGHLRRGSSRKNQTMSLSFSHGINAKKQLGQNFLHSQGALRAIIEAAGLSSKDIVLEIGPGKGALTEKLLEVSGKILAIEKDRELITYLREKFSTDIAAGKLQLVEGDIRDMSLAELGLNSGGFAVVANIPYYLTGELLRSLLSGTQKPSRMVVLVQKEVAERIARSKKESILSLSVKAYGTPKYTKTVKRGSFSPVPNVDSAILAIRDIKDTFTSSAEEHIFFELCHAAFSKKRGVAIRRFQDAFLDNDWPHIFAELAIPLKARPEDIPYSSWRALAAQIA